jgi:hypothetical protein
MARPRKPGRRKPCGRLVQDELENRAGVVAVRRVLDHMLVLAADPAMATAFGRMYLRKEISAAAYVAATKFAVLRAKADRALGVPARNPKALAFGAAHGLSHDHEDPEHTQAIVQAFDDAEAAIGLRSAALRAVEDIVVYGNEVSGFAHKLALKSGLHSLVRHWRLD